MIGIERRGKGKEAKTCKHFYPSIIIDTNKNANRQVLPITLIEWSETGHLVLFSRYLSLLLISPNN
jgi:hypothetical protein